jgi:nitrogen fixation protein NifB
MAKEMNTEMMEKNRTDTHPCFDKEAKLKYARIHLPVAPKCNVQCGYCNRKYDCVNESRPGITSSVLSPTQALSYLRKISQRISNISTIGIAGPGDAFAEPLRTIETIKLIKSEFPDKIFCLSTNGLKLEPWAEELASLGVSHITLTINSLRPETLGRIYQWVRFRKRVYRGREAGELLLRQQMASLAAAVRCGMKVKVNTIIIPGINDLEVREVAQRVSELGASTMNCIPLIPAEGSDMEGFPKPSPELVREIVHCISEYITPMTHCARCRADAAGMLGADDKKAYKMIRECAALPVPANPGRSRVAVASYEGLMINQHLGEAMELLIFSENGEGYELVEKRKAPSKGQGDLRWIELAKRLDDCSFLLVNGVGSKPAEVLHRVGISVVEMAGLINDGLDAVYKGKKLKAVIKTNPGKCGDSCSGTGTGCG